MTDDERHAAPPRGRRLPSIFDGFLPGAPLDLAALEAAMEDSLNRRALAALDRALARPRLLAPDDAVADPQFAPDPPA